MARPARPQRAQFQQSLYADSDDDESENVDVDATPRPAKTKGKSKKRVSDVFHPSNGDGGSSPHRVPLGTVNINDDEAEKRKRRKSQKIHQPMMVIDEADGAPQSSQEGGGTDTPRANRHLKQKQQLMSVAETPVINVPLDVMSSNFEEWMKMATDNKINAANSWNFALIDYFHDMSLLRNNQDNSINFQKASCTLDGCVKIWTSRVDSVGTETGKLLSNLASEGKGDGDDDDGGDPDSNDPTQKQKRKAHRAESTLAKSAAQLQSKKLDLEFSVDPLFKKTCADFDEGGAQGLLMNHLSLGVGSEGTMRVIFDASDSMGKGRDEDEEPDEQEPPDEIDLSYLRGEFFPDLGVLDEKAISHSLAGFSFAKDSFELDTSHVMNATYQEDDDDDFGGGAADFNDANNDAPMDLDGGFSAGEAQGDVEDFFVGDQAVNDDFGEDFDMGADMGDAADGNAPEQGNANHQGARLGGFEPFDPRRAPNERDLILAMTEPGANGSSLDYFDQTFMKNWAGPEHWKIRKVIRPDPTAEGSAPKAKREKKEPFKIDFLTPSTKSQKEIAKEIFAPVTRGASITLPYFSKSGTKKGGRKGKEKEKRPEQTLPDDMHFSSRQLVTLFLKPKFALKMRGQRARLQDGEVDENFWAQAAANQAAGRRDEDADEMENDGAIPFNTQFFHDDDDDGPGFDDLYDGDGMPDGDSMPVDVEPGERDLLSETQGQTRKVRPEAVNYARRAKRVDVRKLKENIWKGLDIVIPPSQGTHDDDGDISMDTTSAQPTDPSETRVFTNVISDLRTSYPKEKMDEISTSFCFICLLHLANEKGLAVEVENEEEPDVYSPASHPEEGKVGSIWGLKVRRDPDAVPSA
ncbi:barren [Schizopora paradoxa]|uniref:Condensin complex subunit 2 n=1 Tax=Schizopora paradoxa TaxID=27342 RepID=A0A0H2S4U9_9AGAM|nr:barren [Schizopora paradoxa]